MNTYILNLPHRNLATTRFNSSRTAFTLLRTISHFICGFFIALLNINFILFNTLRKKIVTALF
ncbi:hypothetical protein [uncultured Gammaproteobacteria bacterium]|nr:hypothetical protein BROOK1789B_1656 [Bathymodiolus brooksi thiotrophic gill symbiont]CAC9634340.1 hypothetical protein [uncultured Gammaproteobacteria bacterium]